MNLAQRRRATAAFVLGAALFAGGAVACDSTGNSGGTVNAQAQGNNDNNALATHFNQIKNPFLNSFPSDPLEQKNLAKRLVMFNSKGSVGYVYLMTMEGKVLGYYVISGKVSSTGSQLTSTQGIHNCDSNYGGGCSVTDTMGDDGTYGPEEGGQNGIFFFTSGGTLIETADPYWVYSSQPIKLYADAPQLGQ